MGMDHSGEDVTFGQLAWHFINGVLHQQHIQPNSNCTKTLRQEEYCSFVEPAWANGSHVADGNHLAVPVWVLVLQTLELIQHGLQRSITDKLNVFPTNHLLRCQTGQTL